MHRDIPQIFLSHWGWCLCLKRHLIKTLCMKTWVGLVRFGIYFLCAFMMYHLQFPKMSSFASIQTNIIVLHTSHLHTVNPLYNDTFCSKLSLTLK